MFGMTDAKRAQIAALLSTYNELSKQFDAACHSKDERTVVVARMDALSDEIAEVAKQIRALDPHGVITG